MLSPVAIQLISALRLSLAAVSALYLAMTLGLENPYWATVTVLVVEGVFPGVVQKRIAERLGGTLLGVVLGLAALIVGGDMRLVLIALCFAAITLTTFLSLEYRNRLLLWRWSALTTLLVVTIGLTYDTYFVTSLSRLWAILLGIATAWVFHVLFFPLASAVGIFVTLKKIVGLFQSVPQNPDADSKVTALAGLYASMEQLHQLLASHAMEKYGMASRARAANQALEALEVLGEQIVLKGGNAREFVASLLRILNAVNPLVVKSLSQAGRRLEALCAPAPADTPDSLVAAAARLGRGLVALDMTSSVRIKTAADVESQAYFHDAWYDSSAMNGYKALIVGVGTCAALWLWSEVAWPGGLIMAILTMLLGQFAAFTHNLPLKALGVLLVLNLVVSGLLMMFVIPLLDTTGGFFLWLFLFHLLFGWLVFSPNKALAFAALTFLILINLSVNGYMATTYAMQVTLTYSWGVAGGLLLGIATALLVKPISARRLLRRQQDAFSAEVARLGSAAPDEEDALARSLRRRARMATVWWQGLTHERDRQGSSESVLDMINRLPEISVEA